MPIDLIVHFACPMRSTEAMYQPVNFKKLIHFYSPEIVTGDYVEPAGRIKEDDIAFYLKKNLSLYGAYKIADQFTCNQIANAIYTVFQESVKADAQKIASLANLDNYFAPHDNAIVIGLKTRLQGKAPVHGDVTNVSQLLPELLTKLYKEYPAHVAHSFRANLNIHGDNQHKYNSHDPIELSNLQVAADHKLPAAVPFIALVHPKINSKQDLELVRTNKLKKDFGAMNINTWAEKEVISPENVLVKTHDDLGCMYQIFDVHADFSAEDLQREQQKLKLQIQ